MAKAIAALGCVALFSPATHSQQAPPVPDAAAATVVFGGSNHYPPFHYRDALGEAAGFDVDIFRLAATRAGLTAQFRFDDWDRIQQELLDGSIDAVPMFVSEERASRYLFSDPINVEYHLLFGPATQATVRELGLLDGRRVATEVAAYARSELERLDSGAELLAASSEAEALRMVARGDADLALVPASVGRYTIRTEALAGLAELSPPLLPVNYAFAIAPNRPDLRDALNAALADLQRTGAIEELRRRWLGENAQPGGSLVLAILFASFVVALVGLWLARVKLRRIAVVLRDQRHQLRSARQQVRELTTRDRLSGLPTRDYFVALLQDMLRTSPAPFAVAVIELRDLDSIQHDLGIDGADTVVRQVANALARHSPGAAGCLAPGRLAAIMPGENVESRMGALFDALGGWLEVEGSPLEVRLRAGYARYPAHADSGARLLQLASIALLHAKQDGQRYRCYEQSMADPGSFRLMADLRLALEEGGLTWVYQPQYCVESGRITCAEMLVRWQHPELGWIPPDRFIVLAEQTGMIRHITRRAIRQALGTLRAWQAEQLALRLSVNISANDLSDPGFVEEILATVAGYEQALTLEITETAIMQDVAAILAGVERLKRARVRISLDDYGTGYASLAYLREFNFDEIKIDKVFIKNIARSERNLMLTRASARLGNELGSEVVAEGVEDEDAARLLVGLGCGLLQGYWIARPLEAAQLSAFVREFRAGPGILPGHPRGAGATAPR